MNVDFFRKYEIRLIGVILVLAFIHGLLYISGIPPWQHYDEPTHFEHAWMIANKGEFPVSGNHDRAFLSELVQSMIANGFYEGNGLAAPDPDNLRVLPAGLRYSQLEDPPLYYLLASVPLRMMRSADLAIQVVAARYVSLLLFLMTIGASWGIMRTITDSGSPLRIFVPFFLALLPGFVDLMTAVNNDVGAVAVFTCFLWAAVRLIRNGFSIRDFTYAILATAAGLFTKSTAYPVAVLLPIVLVLSLVRGRARVYAWGLIGTAVIIGALVLAYKGEAAFWYRATAQSEPIRVLSADTPIGSYALSLDPTSEVTPTWLRMLSQPVGSLDVQRLAGRSASLGFWMWYQVGSPENEEITIASPAVRMDVAEGEDVIIINPVVISETPSFHAVSFSVPEDVLRIWVFMHPKTRAVRPEVRILYDGLVLVEGEGDPGSIPVFDDSSAASGRWDGQPFENILRNPSAEDFWPAFRPEIDTLLSRVMPDNIRLSTLLFSVLDRDGAGWYYRATADHLVQTFFGKFGWGHVPLRLGRIVYPSLYAVLLFACAGATVDLIRRKRPAYVRDVLLFFSISSGIVWAGTFARGAIFIFVASVFIPSARYAFPVIVPTALAFVAGLFALGHFIRKIIRLPEWPVYAAFTSGMVLLAVLAQLSVLSFYR